MTKMRLPAGRSLCLAVVCLAVLAGGLGLAGPAAAEDVDIFTALPPTSSSAPSVLFLVDNSANWSRSSQHWPDGAGNQGAAEMLALSNLVQGLTTTPINIGLGMYSKVGSQLGGYIRFGARDMSVPANRLAFSNILDHIRSNVNSPDEKVNSNDGEAAALYEAYRYFNGMRPFRGAYSSGDPAENVDRPNNNGSAGYTASGQGLSSGFALGPGANPAYQYAGSACTRGYVVLIANNAQGAMPAGQQTFSDAHHTGNALSGNMSQLPGTNNSWTDEWARYLYQSGISVYVIDAYNAQQNTDYSNMLKQAARVGGGRYFQAGKQADIESALKQIMVEIGSVNTAFASSSLPISATNRSQSLNQVYIGVFRPDGRALPRWMGNLKRFQVVASGVDVDLGDALGGAAINPQTGFLNDCAASFWTTDSSSWWQLVTGSDPVPSSACTAFPTVNGAIGSRWSDLPDGPSVEKGGVAEVVRKGNAGTTTWSVSRNLYTLATGSNVPVTVTGNIPGLTTAQLAWVKGADNQVPSERTGALATDTRPSLHGDVVHSRPLPLNYGVSSQYCGTNTEPCVVVYYGSNDGVLRAVNATNGRELWGFISPESGSKLQRLYANSPVIKYPTTPAGVSPTPRSKDYFFDGSLGVYQKADNSAAWIYPTLRRGGRYVYGMNVTDPRAPSSVWRVGCPNAGDDTGCTTNFSQLGQTWSTPQVAYLKGFSATVPVLLFGGGYDPCEDDSTTATPTCASRKGNAVFVVRADTGAFIKRLDLPGGGSVVADLALADVNGDGSIDHAYAVDTLGNIWRADFSGSTGAPAADSAWSIRKVAYTTGGGRKFQQQPALLYSQQKMYVALGSGDRENPLSTQYPYTTPVVNRFYVHLDDLTVPASSTTATAINLDGPTSAGVQDFSAATTCSTPGVTPASSLTGWFMNLAAGRGEQTVTTALIDGGMVTFNTNRPTPDNAACTASLGEARGYWLNLLNASGGVGTTGTCDGARSAVFVGGGLTPSPTRAVVPVDGKPTGVLLGAVQRSGGASSPIGAQRIRTVPAGKRRIIYWRSSAGNE